MPDQNSPMEEALREIRKLLTVPPGYQPTSGLMEEFRAILRHYQQESERARHEEDRKRGVVDGFNWGI